MSYTFDLEALFRRGRCLLAGMRYTPESKTRTRRCGRNRRTEDKGFDARGSSESASVILSRRPDRRLPGLRWQAAGHDGIADADVSFRQDLCSESAPMDQAGDDPFLRQAFQVGARLAQFDSEEPHPADLELLPDEMVQRSSSRGHVPSGRARRDRDLVVPRHGLDGLGLDERDLAAGIRSVRICAALAEVAIPLEPFPRDCANAIDRTHPGLRLVRDVDCDDLSGPGRRAGHDDTEAGPRFNRCPCRFWNDGVRLDFGEQIRIDLATVRGPQKLREILGCLIR